MPHQCVRCGEIYTDGSSEILNGCACGAKLFFYVRKTKVKEAKDVHVNLSPQEKQQIEKDIYELIGKELDPERPVILDFEAISVRKPGKYDLDLVHLFSGNPVVIKLEEGKYIIDLKASLQSSRKSKK
ncbi:MAG: Zn-ribbon domain-containing protein [Candidatus Woesearchaeota archaeon]